VAFADEHQLTK